MSDVLVVHGAHESYYTGKLEAYLRAKGIAYRLEEFTERSMRRCARHTGVLQIPQVECPDGSWLVDTTPIIDYFEKTCPRPAIHPVQPAVAFISRLLEDYGDEWLWRPAMHYRWSYAESARLMSGWLAEHLRERSTPFFMKRWFWRIRQTWVFVLRDGVTAGTRSAVEAAYTDALRDLEAIFAVRPFIMGQRPSAADYGFFASMYRHFFCDPASGRIMRDRAPGVMEWVARMWNLRPEKFEMQAMPDTIEGDLSGLLSAVTKVYLPYLAANEAAYDAGETRVSYQVQGVRFMEPTKPYRVHCRHALHDALAALGEQDRSRVRDALSNDAAFAVLAAAPAKRVPDAVGDLPIAPSTAARGSKPVDSWWR